MKRVMFFFIVLFCFWEPSYSLAKEKEARMVSAGAIEAATERISYRQNSKEIQDFLAEIQKYSNEYFPELADENYLQDFIQGNTQIEGSHLFSKILDVLIGEFRNNLSLLLKIIGITILCSVLKSMQLNFSDTGVGEIAFYVCYLMVITLIMTSFTNVVSYCTETVGKLSDFMNMVVPLIFALMTATGNLTTISFLQPLILGMIALIALLLNRVIIPMIYIATVVHVVTNISSQIQLDKLANLLQKFSLWVMEFCLILFVGTLSLEGTLASSVDGMTTKIAKNLVSSTIPVVGKILGDTVDSVIGGVSITKNAIGVLGVLAILAITVTPLIKSLIMMTIFNLATAFMEPIADSRISKCMNGVAGSIKIVVGILAVVVFIFVIAITMMLKISNRVLMYH